MQFDDKTEYNKSNDIFGDPLPKYADMLTGYTEAPMFASCRIGNLLEYHRHRNTYRARLEKERTSFNVAIREAGLSREGNAKKRAAKKKFSLIASAVAAVAAVAAGLGIWYACTHTPSYLSVVEHQYAYEVESNNTITIKDVKAPKYAIKNGQLAIPDTIEGKPVACIGRKAFQKMDMTSVTMPNTVTDIGYMAFYKCENLISVKLSDNLQGIGEKAFAECTSLKEFKIPKGAGYGEAMLQGCDALETLELPQINQGTGGDLYDILKGAARNSLLHITIHKGRLEHGEFDHYKALKTVYLGEGIEESGLSQPLFAGCTSLTEITVAKIPKKLGTMMCSYSTTGFVQAAGGYVPSSLRRVTVLSGNINESAFNGCSMLASVTIKSETASIGDYAFSGCTNLKNLVAEGKIITVGEGAYKKCTNLTAAPIGTETTQIQKETFYECKNLQEVTISDKVETIGASAFYGCEALKTITIPSSVKSLQTNAFNGCKSLETVSLTYGLQSIASGVFSNCVALKSIEIPDSVTTLSEKAVFSGCSNLEAVTIGSGVIAIGSGYSSASLFSGCTSLKTVTLFSTMRMLASGTFKECSQLSEILFAGTMQEWKNINKYSSWAPSGTDSLRICCSDGTLAKDGTQIVE